MGLAVCLTASFAGWLWFSDGASATLQGFLGPQKEAFYRTIATVSGTMLGFSMTVAALVLNRVSSERFQMLREGNSGKNYATLCKTYTQAVKSLGILTLVSIVALVVDTNLSPSHLVMIPAAFSALLSLFRISRAIWILEKLLQVPV